MMMQIKNGLCLLWLFVLMLLLVACSHRQKDDELWHKDIDEFVSGHQSLMQSHPDSMIMLIRNFKCEGNPDKSDQWKKLSGCMIITRFFDDKEEEDVVII